MEVAVLVVMKRAGGFLLAMPAGVLLEEDLNLASAGDSQILGPSVELEVLSVILDGGRLSPTGATCKVLIIDCVAAIVSKMRAYKSFEFIVYGFDEDQPFALPEPAALMAEARKTKAGSQAKRSRSAFDAWCCLLQRRQKAPRTTKRCWLRTQRWLLS